MGGSPACQPQSSGQTPQVTVIRSRGCGPGTGSASEHRRDWSPGPPKGATEQDSNSVASPKGKPQARDGA